MLTDATSDGDNMYELWECYGGHGEVNFGIGAAVHEGEPVGLRAFIEHRFSHGAHAYVCVVWTQGKNGDRTITKSAAGFSGCYGPDEFHTLSTVGEEQQLPPLRIRFEQ